MSSPAPPTSTNCPHCGGPLPEDGQAVTCQHCGRVLVEKQKKKKRKTFRFDPAGGMPPTPLSPQSLAMFSEPPPNLQAPPAATATQSPTAPPDPQTPTDGATSGPPWPSTPAETTSSTAPSVELPDPNSIAPPAPPEFPMGVTPLVIPNDEAERRARLRRKFRTVVAVFSAVLLLVVYLILLAMST